MKAINKIAVPLLLLFSGFAVAQEIAEPVVASAPVSEKQIRIRDLETLTINSLRKQFPQLPGIFASVHSCHLPDYGPFVTVTLQLPANFLTRPVLIELERRHRLAEQRTRQMREQIEKAAQVITLRIREAGLQERIQEERAAKKKARQTSIEQLEKDLIDVRSSIQLLENDTTTIKFADVPDAISDVDLNKMMVENYNHLIQRVSDAMKDALVENGPKLVSLREGERISIHTVIRENLLGHQGNSILFSLTEADISAFRKGELKMPDLKGKVLVRPDHRE